jgi:hypothetical protein
VLPRRLLQHLAATPADGKLCAELEEAPAHALAEPGAAAGDQDALAGQQIRAKHRAPAFRVCSGKLNR